MRIDAHPMRIGRCIRMANPNIHHHIISLLVNLHVGHLIGHLVNLHDQHHNLSSTTSISIINYKSLDSKVLSRYLHSPGSHQSTRFLELLSDSVTHVGSIASHDAKNR